MNVSEPLHTHESVRQEAITDGTGVLVSISNLEYYFGQGHLRSQVLYDINFNLHNNEIVLLTGPSGSGKTTLLTLIGALRSAHCGSLLVLGNQLVGAKPDRLEQVRRGIGYIFQAHNLLRFLTAWQNVAMSLELDGQMTAEQVYDAACEELDAVGLKQHKNAYPDELSGGQKQRVAVARALATRPRLVLADEPTAALDKHSGRDVVTLMQELSARNGSSILMVTHDSRIFDIAHRIVEVEDGKLISQC